MIAECPDSWENMAKVNLVTAKDPELERAVFFTGYQNDHISQLSAEARNCAVLDCACCSTVCGETWMRCYLQSLGEDDRA